MVSTTMEIQSGNGEELEVVSGESLATSGSVSSSPYLSVPQADGTDDQVLREDLQAAKTIERFDIPLSNLKRMFEKPPGAANTEVRTVQSSPSRRAPASSYQLDQKRDPSPGEKMASTHEPSLSAGGTRSGRPEEREGVVSQRKGDGGAPTSEEAESVSLKERMAMYQAAVSKKEASSSSPTVMEESEACSLPGGLASVKKQFESQEYASSSQSQTSVTQVHLEKRSEVSSSQEVTVRSSVREVIPTTQQVTHDQRVQQSNVASSYENHYDETVRVIGGEDLPKVSTQALKQQYEKTIEQATPGKQIKIDLDYNQFQWAPVNQSSSAAASYESSSTVKQSSRASAATTSSMDYETMEHFPPPPTELMPQEVPECCDSLPPQEQAGQQRYIFNKEQYSKQRNRNELKRLYKHMHPEVRRTMEKDYFTDVTEIEQAQLDSDDEMTGEVQQACYVFENSGGDECMSPEGDYLEWDEILKGEVQSMRWMFENKPLDTIKDDTPDEDDEVKNIAQQEIIAGSDVKYTAWMFETQPMDALRADTPDSTVQTGKLTELARGDVRTATYLFETQPLDCLNKIYQEDEQALEVVFTKDITGGDVKTARYLFETQHLDSLSHTETIEESHFLKLKSELEEIKGEVKTTTRMFETQPMCVIRGNSGNILEITAIRREEMEKGDVKTSRWLFETQALDMINKDPAKVKLICGVSMEDNSQGDVNRGRWLFETKTLDSIKDEEWQSIRQKEEIIGADVRKHCLVFETQQMDTLKDNANSRPLPSEEIVGGDVRSAKHLFETVPMENLKDLAEVGKLQKMVASEEEKGDVRHQKWVFESQPLENIREEKKEMTSSINLEELDKGDVTNHKERFETLDLSRCEGAQRIQVEGVTSGSVKSNKVLFESTPMYAMQDSEGHYHEVKTVRREEIVKGDVRSCRWMFETRPIDEFDESSNKFQIIKGISKEEIESGDVKTAKWLFETQPLDGIKHFSNTEEDETKTKESVEIEKGDVKTCRWLFETQPMDNLYEKADKVRNETEVEEVNKGDVKTCTWLFETQNLDNICDHSECESETILKTCTVKQEDVQGKDVHHARFLFETENLENLTGEESGAFRRVTKIDVQSGDVSRMKFLFQNRSSDIMTSTSSETMHKLKTLTAEEIQKGNVVNNMWLFENQPIDTIRKDTEEAKDTRTVTDVQGGNVGQGRFVFETYSLDKIQEESTETEMSKLQSIIRDDIEKGDVKSYTMMFENQPLYAICDKEGHYHEVTTMTKEEIMSGDVVGARWLFETKPLDSIRDTDDVYVIKSVTEEDVQKGDVSTARWRFETQPLDEIAEDMKVLTKTVEDIQGGDVKTNKHLFETDEMSQKYVRTVSVSEIQKGDVRTASWMFETHSIDKIHGEGSEYDEMETVTKEEVMKGDVKQSVWLFEKQPLDSIKESDGTETVVTREEIPQADVKTTTWLFETTPLTKFNENSVDRTEIMGKSIKETLEELYCQKMVDSQGILIETDEIGDVRMAKYRLMNQDAPEIQKEEVIRGDLNNIMMNLLNRRDMTEKGIVIDQDERGNINTTVKQLFNQEKGFNVEKEEILRGDIQEAINNLLKEEGSSKRGILIQEDEKGDVRMTIYSLLNKEDGAGIEKEDIIKGNVSRTLHRLLSNPGSEESKRIRVEDTERGNVSFYSTCIESGALDYLKQLQFEPNEEQEQAQKERIIGGDVMETKMTLRKNQQQIERTVAEDDIVPGDVNNTVKVFMMEPALLLENLQKEEIVKGDLRAALDSLTKTISKRVVIEKEEVVKGDLHTTLRSLEEAQNQAKEMEKPEIVRGDIRGALQSLEKSATTKTEVTVEDLVPGDIKGTLKSLEEAKQAVKEMEKEEIVKGDIHTALKGLHEASSEKRLYQHQVSEQGDVRGTIQLLVEPSTSPRMQRRGSTEGDVKTSIKCLYEGQGQDQDEEQSQMEKEEVIKGDVKGAIKNLMQRKEYSNRKVRKYPPRKAPRAHVKNPLPTQQVVDHEYSDVAKNENVTVNLAPAVKNLSSKSQDTTQKHTEKYTENKSVKRSKTLTQEEHSMTTQVQTVNMLEDSQQEHSSQQTHVKEQAVKQKIPPPPKPIFRNKKNVSNQMTDNTSTNQMKEIKAANQMTENKAASDINVMKERQSTSQTNIVSKQTQETKTMKQLQTTVTEHKTVTQKHNVKNLNTNFRNLDMKGKGMLKKGTPEINFPPPPTSPPPPSESEMSLPPPPSPVAGCPMSLSSRSPMFPTSRPLIMRQDSDLPPPPPPPPVECGEPDFFPSPPPPPPPSVAGQDFLPPPPSQQELNSMPHQVPTPPPGKPFKARPLFKIPKPEPPKQPILVKPKWQKKQAAPPPTPPPPQPMTVQTEHKKEGVVQEVKSEISCKQEENTNTTNTQVQSDSTVSMTKIPSPIPVAKPSQEELPRPPKKVFIPPIKIPPPAELAPVAKPKPYARKFKTPLMLAEERYRVQREEADRNKSQDTTPATSRVASPSSPPTNMMQMMGSTNVASEQHSVAHKTEQSKVTSEVTQAEETQSKSKVCTASQEPPMKKALSHIPLSKPLISMVNKKSTSESGNISSDKKHITTDQSSMASSGKELTSSVASRKHQSVPSGKHQSVSSGKHQAVSVSAAHLHHEFNIKVQSGSNVISSSVAEQQSGMNASSQSIISTQSIVQENVNLQTQSAVTSEAEDAKNTNALLTKEVKKIPSQPTKIKIPKVTPNFKVRTVKLPTEKKEEKSEVVEKDQRAVKNELHVHQTSMETISKSETRVVQESTQMATSSSAKNEVKVEMNVTQEKAEEVEKTAAAKETTLEIQMKTKAKQKGIKVPLPKEPKLVPMPVAQTPGHCHISVSHSQQSMQEQHIQKHEQVIVNERVVQQSFQKQEQQVRTQKQQVKSFQQQGEVSKMQQHQERLKAESKADSMNIAGKAAAQTETAQSMVENTAQSVEESTDSEKCVMVQKLLFNIKQLHPGNMDSNSVRTILSEVPDWLIRAEEKRDLTQVAVQQNKKKLTEILFRVRNLAQAKLVFLEGHMAAMAKQESEPAPASSPAPPPAPSPAPPPAPALEKKGFGGATAKISKISIGSSRVETHKKVVEEKKISHESKKPELTEVKGPDPRVPSPMLATRTPSPTFISIESVRRTNSPFTVTPSPPLSYRSGATPTPPPPPPRTPTSRFCRATPSPTLSRSEKLAKLKDTTAKLSRGMTPPPPMPEFLTTEQASDREDSPALIEPEIHMQTQEMETGTTTPDVADMVDSMMTVRDKKFFFEEAQKAEVSRTYMRKDPIEIPERLGPEDIEEVPEGVNIDIMKEDLPRLDLSKLVNQFESPQPKLYIRKDPIIITDRLGSDTEDPEADPKTPKTDETPAFNIKAIKNAFDLGDRNALKEVREKQEERERRESESAEPTGHSKTKSVTEEFSGMDEFGTVTRGVRSETSMHSESHMTRPLPPSYADVVKGTVEEMAVPVEAATEDLLKSFHQSWAESESVFQNLGFSVSEQRTSQIVTHQQETVVTENSSSRVRTVYGVSEEGVSDGVSDRRQTQFP
ncbi:xin actin-binding repeat-containing protein 2-like [Salvelinus namaycush]|uniref:Xin actin-binding repeat-containing protein 2-like n=1 Tax=Salvelinus namaycush TaxID=8040 RepID=A0A8U0Q371_SALNM|nr:xin actin-binding repeat-containing protein 2-like [Salvelinus namaycush]